MTPTPLRRLAAFTVGLALAVALSGCGVPLVPGI